MSIDKLAKKSFSVALHVFSMGVLLLPLIWFSGGINLRDNQPVPPIIKTDLLN